MNPREIGPRVRGIRTSKKSPLKIMAPLFSGRRQNPKKSEPGRLATVAKLTALFLGARRPRSVHAHPSLHPSQSHLSRTRDSCEKISNLCPKSTHQSSARKKRIPRDRFSCTLFMFFLQAKQEAQPTRWQWLTQSGNFQGRIFFWRKPLH